MAPLKQRRRRGQAMLESGLVMVVFITTLVAIFDFGQLLFIHTSMVERVRGTLRWGTVRAYDAASMRNMVLYNQPVVESGVYSVGFLGLQASNVSIERLDADTENERLKIAIVNYDFNFVTPFLAKTFRNNLAVVETIPMEYKP